MTSTKDICWLAGLLEGEGCFCYDASPGIKLGMTDKDVVERAATLFRRHVRGPYQYKGNRKPVYYTEIWANNAIGWMQTILPLMGERRRQRIIEIVERWKKSTTRSRLPNGITPTCHPKRRHYAHRLCLPCYGKVRHQNSKKGK